MKRKDALKVQLAKKMKRRTARQSEPTGYLPNTGLRLNVFDPLNDNQSRVYDAFQAQQHLLLTGTAGTGKTFLAIYLGLKEILEKRAQHTLVIVRSVVPSRDIGFLPGSAREKTRAYEAPYYSIMEELFGRGDAYDILKGKGMVEFISTSFVRGTTINDCVVVVDECQNMADIELHSVFTRVGNNCRVILSGDVKQNDLKHTRSGSGFSDFIKVIQQMRSFSHVEFTRNDVVRSDLVREYIILRDRMEESHEIAML